MIKSDAIKIILILASSFKAIAAERMINRDSYPIPPMHPFFAGIAGGFGVIEANYTDTKRFLGRVSFGLNMVPCPHILLGLEFGAQSGKNLRLKARPDDIYNLSTKAILRPEVDALVTFKYKFYPPQPLYIIAKGGIAAR